MRWACCTGMLGRQVAAAPLCMQPAEQLGLWAYPGRSILPPAPVLQGMTGGTIGGIVVADLILGGCAHCIEHCCVNRLLRHLLVCTLCKCTVPPARNTSWLQLNWLQLNCPPPRSTCCRPQEPVGRGVRPLTPTPHQIADGGAPGLCPSRVKLPRFCIVPEWSPRQVQRWRRRVCLFGPDPEDAQQLGF